MLTRSGRKLFRKSKDETLVNNHLEMIVNVIRAAVKLLIQNTRTQEGKKKEEKKDGKKERKGERNKQENAKIKELKKETKTN